MKRIGILILGLIFSSLLFSQEIKIVEIKSDVNNVTVFIDGAQVIRKKIIDLTQGKSILKFENLSPFIDPKSVQVKVEGELTVLSVNHQQNYLDKMEKPKELQDLEKSVDAIESKIIRPPFGQNLLAVAQAVSKPVLAQAAKTTLAPLQPFRR